MASTIPLETGIRLVRHRGPDDEGFLLWNPEEGSRVFGGPESARASISAHRLRELPRSARWRVGLAHRRLSIVDLSPAGHQPMVHRTSGLTVVYNGEIYNHVELRRELEASGHRFESACDTEVLLAAWAEWGPACLHRFNGMFAFVLLDPRDQTVHAVRDRFGVKPLYWARIGDLLGIASEIKELRGLPGFRHALDEASIRDYLAAGLLDHSRHTFDRGISQLLGGERMVMRLRESEPAPEIIRWYELRPTPYDGTLADAADEFCRLLADSVRLRLRADVPVGSCLSGGLDSSAIVCLAARALAEQEDHAGQVTVTARYEDSRFDEWRFAEQIIERTGATPVIVWPDERRLQTELDDQLWYMDEPFGSTSQFSQWCVFGAAAEAGLKVMLDGQGSDEQLAGYAGNDMALYTGMLRRPAPLALGGELLSFRRRHHNWPIAQVLLAIRNTIPAIDALLPGRVRRVVGIPEWLRTDAPTHLTSPPPRNLNESLREQTLSTSLPVLLRYEDRNSMAWSIESRVPFLDYRLVEFLAGLRDDWKLRRGTTKLVMREALRGVLPEPVRDRRDKMGFVTPEVVWLRETATPWFRQAVRAAIDTAPGLFDPDHTLAMFERIADGSEAFTFTPWRVLCFGRWLSRQDEAPAGPRQSRPLAGQVA